MVKTTVGVSKEGKEDKQTDSGVTKEVEVEEKEEDDKGQDINHTMIRITIINLTMVVNNNSSNRWEVDPMAQVSTA